MASEETLQRIKKSRDYLRNEDNQSYVSELEHALEKLKSQEGFLNIDYIIELRKKLKSVILSAKLKLLDEDDMQKRVQIKSDIEAYSWLLPFFAKNVEKEKEEIDQKLEEML